MPPLLRALSDDSGIPLDVAALDLARIEFPDLDPEPYLHMLDGLAADIDRRLSPRAGGRTFVLTANACPFGEHGFAGAEANYHDPRNSCLNFVLEQRRGLPITLSLLYMEVARRLAKPVFGIGLPAHFVIEYDDGDYRLAAFAHVHLRELRAAFESFELYLRYSPDASDRADVVKQMEVIHRWLGSLN